MNDPGTASLVGAIIADIVFSFIVALLAIKKPLGYWKAFVISFFAGIVFIMFSAPFDGLGANIICGIVYLFLPKKKPEQGTT